MFRMDKGNRNILYSSLVFLVCYILLAVIAMRPVYSFDGYWHLQMGKDLLENSLSPWVDHYSFSHQGKEISSVPVLFQMLLYQFVSFFGEREGFYFIRLFYVTLLMSVLFVYFRKIKASGFIVFILLPILVYLIHLRLMLRPEIFSNVLIVICLLLYLKAQKTFATKELVFICLLLLFWVNYHSPIIGYIIIFGLFLDKAINKLVNSDESFKWIQWFLWGGAIFLIGFIRPNGQHFMVTMVAVLSDDFGKYTQEYMESYPIFSKNMVVHVSWVLSTYAVVWSLIKKQYGFVFIVVLLTYFSWSTMRLITVAMLVNLCILALYFSQLSSSRHLSNIHSSIKNVLFVVTVGISVLAFYYVGKEAFSSIKKNENKSQLLEERYPVQVVDYLKRYQDGGNILNVMHTGGYLINKLSPDFKIYYDGRTNILYPIDFVKYNLSLLRNSAELNKMIGHYDVKYALFKNTPEIFAFLNKSEKLELNFADENYLLFAENKNNAFPLSSMLLVFPSCWNEYWSQDILKEIALSEELFVNRSYTLKFVHAFMKDYLLHENKQHFFDTLQAEKIHSDAVRRIASYLALNAGNNEAASNLFSSIQEKTEYDILIHTYHLAKNQEYEAAENLLYYFYTVTKFVKKKIVSFDKIAMMVRILEILEDNAELQHFESSYKGELEDKLKKVNYNAKKVLSFDYICK